MSPCTAPILVLNRSVVRSTGLTLSEAQLWVDEDRAAQIVANGPAANVANGAAGEKFYAILRGRRLGVFNSWHEAQRSTDGFRHSRHKSFDTHAAATAWLERNNLVATELEASANAERLRDRRLASPVASDRDLDNVSTSRVGVLANIGAAGVQISRGLTSWVSHRINTHDAPSQEQQRTGSKRDCGSSVSSKPEHTVVPPVLDRADGPALHTPQSAPSRVSSLRGSTGPVAPSTAPHRNSASSMAPIRSLLTSNSNFGRRASGADVNAEVISSMESSAADAGTTLLASTRLTSQFSTSSMHQSSPPKIPGTMPDAAVLPNSLLPRRSTREALR